jgi:hypothetical protein
MMKRPAASIEGARVKESGFCISRNGLLATLAYPLLSFIRTCVGLSGDGRRVSASIRARRSFAFMLGRRACCFGLGS